MKEPFISKQYNELGTLTECYAEIHNNPLTLYLKWQFVWCISNEIKNSKSFCQISVVLFNLDFRIKHLCWNLINVLNLELIPRKSSRSNPKKQEAIVLCFLWK